MNIPKIEQCYAYDEKLNISYFVTTGATLNNKHFLTTPVIVSRYLISDNTLRKKYIKYGKINIDYIYSDGKVLVSEDLINKLKIKEIPIGFAHRNSITRKHQIGKCFPYNIVKSSAESNKIDDNLKKSIIKEIKNMSWDEFITIAPTTKFIDQDMWDNAMLKFTDILGSKYRSKNLKIAYSTERSINIRNKYVNSKFDNNHRHIHLFLNKDGIDIKPLKLKKAFLSAMDMSKFKRYEYYSEPFKKDIFGENYILKTYSNETDCFSMCVPDQSILG